MRPSMVVPRKLYDPRLVRLRVEVRVRVRASVKVGVWRGGTRGKDPCRATRHTALNAWPTPSVQAAPFLSYAAHGSNSLPTRI